MIDKISCASLHRKGFNDRIFVLKIEFITTLTENIKILLGGKKIKTNKWIYR